VLRSIFHDGIADFHGDEVTVNPEWPVDVPGGAPLPVYVAAMGPQALRVSGELADGTLPYLAGPHASWRPTATPVPPKWFPLRCVAIRLSYKLFGRLLPPCNTDSRRMASSMVSSRLQKAKRTR
jgi:alkanesulfonate monooxygenase SsuD/methylene tetrahydromethanopterin reductase-like flavin-dependent oxidoreductase (luciferase family)